MRSAVVCYLVSALAAQYYYTVSASILVLGVEASLEALGICSGAAISQTRTVKYSVVIVTFVSTSYKYSAVAKCRHKCK